MYRSRLPEIDETDWAMLRELHANARITLGEASRRVGLTGSFVGERLRRLEDAGVAHGYHATTRSFAYVSRAGNATRSSGYWSEHPKRSNATI